MNFEAAILEGDRAKVFRPIGPDFFREEDNVRLIYRPKISGEGVEVLEGGEEVMLDQVPVPLEESGAKAVRSRAGVIVHREKGSPDLVKGEKACERRGLGGVERSGGNKLTGVRDVGGMERGAQKRFEEVMKD
jgi:hypothetical protein